MNVEKYLKDISEIKSLMTESSKFMSLTGLSGLFSGIYALIGATYLYWDVSKNGESILNLNTSHVELIVIILSAVLILSTISTFWLTIRKAKKNKEKTWNSISKKLAFNFYGILLFGGSYLMSLLFQEKYQQIIPLMLVFYGFAIVNGAKYTFKGVVLLGYIQLFLGLVCTLFQGYEFWFWVIGFGVVHVIYGSFMHFKYRK